MSRPAAEINWKRNLVAVTGASFVGFTGFTLVMPFLPLYIQQLGVTDVGEIAWWTGLTLGATPALTALCGPFWGRVADRLGSKLMVMRALSAFVLCMAAMAFVTRPWHLLALRALLGLFAGYGTLALSMAAESAPREKMAQAIGAVQTAQRLGPAIGPVVGGLLAPLVGLRASFLVAAAVYAVAVVVVWLMYVERPRERRPAEAADTHVEFRSILAFENFLLLMGVIFGLQFADRSFGPVLPLWVAQSGVPAARVPFVSGVLFSVMAVAAALGHHSCGRLLQVMSARVLIAVMAVVAAASVLAFAFTHAVAAMILAMAVFGVAVGAAMTASYTAAGSVVPSEAHATGFGFLTSASLVGLAVSPVLNGFVGAASLRTVFLLDAAVLAILAIVVRRVMVDRRLTIESPSTEEA